MLTWVVVHRVSVAVVVVAQPVIFPISWSEIWLRNNYVPYNIYMHEGIGEGSLLRKRFHNNFFKLQ